MDNKKFTQLLAKTVRAAFKHQQLLQQVNEECVKRYGVGYGEIDCDTIIDVMDYGGCEQYTAKQFDTATREAMDMAGIKQNTGG